MQRHYHRWYSPHLMRDMELLVFGESGARVLIFPTRTGRFFDYENWGLVEAVRNKIENGWIQLICVDSIDAESPGNRFSPPAGRIMRHLQYETYVLREVLPFTLELNPNPHLIAHGCSMGAFHAVNLAFRHPHVVSKVVAFSGRYDLTVRAGNFEDLFDGYHDETIYSNTPLQFVPNICDGPPAFTAGTAQRSPCAALRRGHSTMG